MESKKKNGELYRMFGYAGKFHGFDCFGMCSLRNQYHLSMLPFVCIWLVIRDLIQAFAAGIYLLQRGAPIMRGWRLCLQRQAF